MVGLKTDGSLVAWGDDKFGQCAVPAPNAAYMAAAAGEDHSLGLKAGGSVVAWGLNSYGQCTVPTPNSGFVAVAAGSLHSLGLKSDGSVVAWGNNADGQCTIPTPNSGFMAISAGSYFSMGLKSDGTIVTWGKNDRNQCNVPAPNTNFVAMAAGQDHAVGLKSDGSIVVWGHSADGAHAVPGPNNNYGVTAWPQQLGLLVDACRVIATNSVTLTTSQTEIDLSRNAPVLTVQNCGQLITPSLMNKLPLRILNNGLLAWQGVGWWTNSARRTMTDEEDAGASGGLWARGYVFMDEGSLSAGVSNMPSGGAIHQLEITNKMALTAGTTFGALAGMVGGDITVQGDATGTVMAVVSSMADAGRSNWTASVTARVENAVIAGGAVLNLRQGITFQGIAQFNANITESAAITDGTNGAKSTTFAFDPLMVHAGATVTVGTASGPVVVDLSRSITFRGSVYDLVENADRTNRHLQQYAFAVTHGGEGLGVRFDGYKLDGGAGMMVTSMTMDVETDLNTGLYQSLTRFYLSDGSVMEVYRATSGQVLPTLTPGPGVLISLDIEERDGVHYIVAGNRTEQGTPWDWLRSYGFTNAFETADQADPDSDRVATSHEYVMNTDPTNGLAFLSITGMGQIGGAISWMGMTGRVYDVQASSNVLDWATLPGASNLPGTGSAAIFTNSSVDNSPLNYRLRVRVAE